MGLRRPKGGIIHFPRDLCQDMPRFLLNKGRSLDCALIDGIEGVDRDWSVSWGEDQRIMIVFPPNGKVFILNYLL